MSTEPSAGSSVGITCHSKRNVWILGLEGGGGQDVKKFIF